MDLVFLYGPPAAGKLTVGRELAKLTGYTLFHNHQSIDWARELIELDGPGFWRLVLKLRNVALEEAVEARMSLITTFVYIAGFDLTDLDRLCAKVADDGGRTCFVRLNCDIEALEARVVAEERVAMRKLSTLGGFRDYVARLDVTSALPGRESLHIDTTHVAPGEAARRIVEHYGLPLRADAVSG
jgi:hypothetical protein